MHLFSKKILIVSVVLLACIGAIVAYVLSVPPEEAAPQVIEQVTEKEPVARGEATVIGKSVEGRAITAYRYGEGDTNLLFVGGVHGGYEWNSVFLAYRAMDYFTEHPEAIPENVAVTVIPSLNPDGLFAVVGVEGRFSVEDAPDAADPSGLGRFNAHRVDLNRNFDCRWQSESTWRGKTVSAGTSAFSEPEAAALRDFILAEKPSAAVFWHSQSNAVYASECEAGILPQTRKLMNAYATAAGYPAVDSFDAYPVTGDAEGWLASLSIPAITVELATHETIEWDKNRAGILAILKQYEESASQ